MPLHVSWKNCGENLEDVKENAFYYGVTMMALGVDEVTPENASEVDFRLAVFKGLHPREYKGLSSSTLMGISINGIHEPFSRWIKRVHDREVPKPKTKKGKSK